MEVAHFTGLICVSQLVQKIREPVYNNSMVHGGEDYQMDMANIQNLMVISFLFR